MFIPAVCLVAVYGSLLVAGADVYRAMGGGGNVQSIPPSPPRQQVNSQANPVPNERTLERDLAQLIAAAATNPPEVEGQGRLVRQNDAGPGDSPNDLDLQLLYDLVRAVEYETNFQLFNNVLKDLENIDPPPPSEEQEQKHDDVSRDLANELEDMVGSSDGSVQKGKLLPDKSGVMSAATVESSQQRTPLHERIAAALEKLPKSPNGTKGMTGQQHDEAILPSDFAPHKERQPRM